MSQSKRTKRVEIRLTTDEHQQLIERKTKPRLAEWLRELGLSQKPKRQAKPVNPKLLFQLNRIGINLNQIAKQCNQTKPNIDLVNIGISLREIENLLREVKNDC